MAVSKVFIVLSVLFAVSQSQRSPYAGRHPVGYPDLQSTTAATTTTQSNNGLSNKFGEGSTPLANQANQPSTTTMRLPPEALGDRELFNRLNQLPDERKPFWVLNWQHMEALRRNPQTYQPNPSGFNSNNWFFGGSENQRF